MSCEFAVCNIEWGRREGTVERRGAGKGSMLHLDSVPTIESMIVAHKPYMTYMNKSKCLITLVPTYVMQNYMVACPLVITTHVYKQFRSFLLHGEVYKQIFIKCSTKIQWVGHWSMGNPSTNLHEHRSNAF